MSFVSCKPTSAHVIVNLSYTDGRDCQLIMSYHAVIGTKFRNLDANLVMMAIFFVISVNIMNLTKRQN